MDELNGEIEILKEDLNSMSQGKSKSESRVKELETEIKQFKADEEKRKTEEKEGALNGLKSTTDWFDER